MFIFTVGSGMDLNDTRDSNGVTGVLMFPGVDISGSFPQLAITRLTIEQNERNINLSFINLI